MLNCPFKRRLQWLSICEHQVFGLVKHKRAFAPFIKEMSHGNICRQPHLFYSVRILHVIATPELIEGPLTISTDRLTANTDSGASFKRFNLADQHQRFEIAFVLPETRRKVSYPVATVGSRYFGTEHIGVFNIVLPARKFTEGKQ